MKTLIKYKLDFKLAYAHVQDNLELVNHLSSNISHFLNLENGYFFTLLPKGANVSYLYNFREEGVFFQQLTEEQHNKISEKLLYSRLPSINEKLSNLMLKEINNKNPFQLSYIFDDYNSNVNQVIQYDLFKNCGYFFKKEVYYVLNNKNISVDVIKRCLHDSNTLWRSLCVFTAADFSKIDKELTENDFEEICQKANLFMVWAYDSAGYIFWEKEGCHFFE